MALLLRQVAKKLAGGITPTSSYFAGEDEELARFGPHQFGILSKFDFLDLGNGDAAGGNRGSRPGLSVGLDRGDQSNVADDGHPVVEVKMGGHYFDLPALPGYD